MFRLSASVCIDAPADAVWARLAALEDFTLWSEPVLRARCDGPRSRGVGAERTCDLAGNVTIRERWVRWDEGRSFAYEGAGLPLVKRARNVWSVQPEGARQARLTSAAAVELNGGVVGRLLEPLMAAMSRRLAARSLAAFKYLVEHGHPYGGRHSELPRAPATC
jgi:hypothetical protein